jgi:hypothetical protein
MAMTTSDQWLRRVSLIVADASGNGLDLSDFRIKFNVTQADISSGHFIPKSATITVYNLAASTVKKIETQFTQVTRRLAISRRVNSASSSKARSSSSSAGTSRLSTPFLRYSPPMAIWRPSP